MKLAHSFAAAMLVAVPAYLALAYNPPVDRAGPLKVTIEGPEEVTEVGVPLPVRVVLENSGERPIQGTVALGLVDRWSAEPAEPMPFEVPAEGTVSQEFTVTAGEGTYNAHYPIHAFARFEHNGQSHTAHPILILETKLPSPPRPERRVPWQPFTVAADSELALWRLPVHRSIVKVFDGDTRTLPVGWQGRDEATYGHLHIQSISLDRQSRETVAIHPPWRGSAGTLAVEYPLQLPDARPLTLRFAHAVTPDGQGDGVTFRVRVVPLDAPEGQWGEVVYEQHSTAKDWSETGEADLGRFAGKAVRLQLESHPGPKHNTGWDQSYWAEPILTAGVPPTPAAFPPAESANSVLLGTVSPGREAFEVRVWPGNRGLLDSAVGFVGGDRSLLFHGFQMRVLGGRIDDVRSPLLLERVETEQTAAGYCVRHFFTSPLGPFELVGRLAVREGVLQAAFELDNVPAMPPWQAVFLEDVAAGPFSREARQVYAGHGHVVREPGPFALRFDGHRLATSFVGADFDGGLSLVQGVDVAPDRFEVAPDRRHCSLHAAHRPTFTFIPAANVWDGVKVWRDVNGLEPAGGVEKVAGRFVFDLWGGRYGETAESLRRAFRYGLGGSMVIFHNWQRWGYDYRLPDIYPPNPDLGTQEELLDLIAACRESGTLFALHDNYIDFYPDADEFSYEKHIAFTRGGEPVKAWLNEGRNARSYRFRADSIEPFLKRNLALIRENLAPTAYFIDVWSSAPPYDYWTADGRFFDQLYTRKVWGDMFAWIRDYLGDNAPQISESGHDQLIGRLDGAQTNHLRVGTPIPDHYYTWSVLNWPCAAAERTPWFDAAHHDRFILHGAGYAGRYAAGLDHRLHGIYSDDYMATEVLTGHSGMVPEPFSHQVVRKHWLLNDLMHGLALKRIESVQYVGDDLHRQHVRWSEGAEVWVNRGESDWQVQGHVLPQYGFLARAPVEGGTVEASVARRDGIISESVRTPRTLYVNGRLILDGPHRIQPGVTGVHYEGRRSFTLALQWQADDPIPGNYRPFLHFCDEQGEILFQAGQDPRAFETARQGTIVANAGGRILADAKPGDEFDLLAGLYDPEGGARLALSGPATGDRRIRLGKLRVEGHGDEVTGVAWTPHEEPAEDPFLARHNPERKPIDFGAVVTAGGIRLHREGPALIVTPLPNRRGPEFDVTIRLSELPWTVKEPVEWEAVNEDGGVLSREVAQVTDGTVSIVCRPDVFGYRLLPKAEE
ncbi:MAG: hypothetical protein RBS80_19185 [Thermoguttaceae bacterium]|jgi:hypothetical protein|nr:hypothetical protein [Thermoguttaceae bacterium]